MLALPMLEPKSRELSAGNVVHSISVTLVSLAAWRVERTVRLFMVQMPWISVRSFAINDVSAVALLTVRLPASVLTPARSAVPEKDWSRVMVPLKVVHELIPSRSL